MRRTKRTAVVAALIAALSMVLANFALADDIYNNLDTSIDAAAEIMALTVGGSNGTTVLSVATTGEDGKNGCNLTGSTTFSASVSSSDVTKATVSPSSVTFTSCSDTKTLSVIPVAVGSTTISLSQTGNTTDGTFNLAPATFTVNVSAATVTDPCLSVSTPDSPVFSAPVAPTSGWFQTAPSAAATSTSTNASILYSTDDGVTFGAEPTLGEGTTTVIAKATSTTCNKSSQTSRTFKVDSIAPVIVAGDVENTTWRNTALSQNFTASDTGGSGLATASDAAFTLTASAESTKDSEGNVVPSTASKTVTDVAGNSTKRTLSARIDQSDPTVGVESVSGTSGNDGWYRSNVTVTFRGTDFLSGFEGGSTKDEAVTSSGQGEAVAVNSPAFTDLAGNTVEAGDQAPTYKIDKDGPDVSCGSASTEWSATDVSIACTATDSASGLANAGDATFNLTTNVSEGTETSSASTGTKNVGDVAGNSSSASAITGIKVDKKKPTVSADQANETWTNAESVTSSSFTANDGGSGLAVAGDESFTLTATQESTKDEGVVAPTQVTKNVDDAVGNRSTATFTALIDRTKPTAALSGGPVDGATYLTTGDNAVPNAPAGNCNDDLSGLATTDGCVVSGYSTAVGHHTVKVTAKDKAGNTKESATLTYTVREMTHTGFYAPVDMGASMLNTVKGGSTVPLKFNVKIGGVEQTSNSVVTSFKALKVTCASGVTEDTIEILSSGSTLLRHDGTQFIQNWKTPTGAGTCYKAVATLADGDVIAANFKLK